MLIWKSMILDKKIYEALDMDIDLFSLAFIGCIIDRILQDLNCMKDETSYCYRDDEKGMLLLVV